jgi:hypothetical protein
MNHKYENKEDEYVYTQDLIQSYTSPDIYETFITAYRTYWDSLIGEMCTLSNFYTNLELDFLRVENVSNITQLDNSIFINGIFKFHGYSADESTLYFERDFGASFIRFNVRYDNQPNEYGLIGLVIQYTIDPIQIYTDPIYK